MIHLSSAWFMVGLTGGWVGRMKGIPFECFSYSVGSITNPAWPSSPPPSEVGMTTAI